MQYVNGFKIAFAFYAVVITLIFLHFLSEILFLHEYNTVLILLGIYLSAMFAGGFVIGYYDKFPADGSKQSFIYHFITFTAVTILSVPWFFITIEFNIENILYALIQTAAWGIGLFFHWLFTHRRFSLSLKKIKN